MFKTGHICSQPDALYLALDIIGHSFFKVMLVGELLIAIVSNSGGHNDKHIGTDY